MTTQNDTYCLNCFSLIPADAEICPVCGANITSLSAQEFKEKLLHALDHPLDDVRMRVIAILVQRHEEGIALALAGCALRHPMSYDEAIEIVHALQDSQAFPDGRHALELLAKDHPAHTVRVAAQEALST